MALLLKHWRTSAALVLGLFALFTLARDRSGKTCSVVVDAREIRSLCKTPCAQGDVWERLNAMGVFGVLVRPESVADLAARGTILRYTKKEIAKMRATKIAATAAPLTPGALWVRSAPIRKRLIAAVDAHGFPKDVRIYEKQDVIVLPDTATLEAVSAGYPPEEIDILSEKGLRPIFLASTVPEGRLAADGGVTLLSADFQTDEGREWASGRTLAFSSKAGGLAKAIGRMPRALRASFLQGAPRVERIVTAGEVRVSDGPGAFLREASAHGNALVVARLDMDRSLDDNFFRLRSLLKVLRREGYATQLDRSSLRWGGRVEWIVRFFLGFFLTVAAPILALRLGVGTVRRMHAIGRLPEASPFREALGAVGTSLAVSILLGAVIYALMAVPLWRLDASILRWADWAATATFVLSWLALYDPDPRTLSIFFRKPLERPSEMRVALPVAAATFLFYSPEWFEVWGPRSWLSYMEAGSATLWWVSARWREWLIGYPCLLVGFCIFYRRLSAPKISAGRDPRGWLLLGMFAPIGLAQAAAAAKIPFVMLAAHTVQGAAAGVFLGLVFLAVRLYILRRLRLHG